MSNVTYLHDVLPSGTRYSLRLIKPEGKAVNQFYDSVDNMQAAAQHYCQQGWNVYYATAGFGAGPKAEADNAVSKRELYVDVDCGPKKPYPTKVEGLQALKNFCSAMGLPRPTVIDSGNGIHAHWVFAQPVPVHEWEPVAKALKARCAEKEFHVDPACTADTVRVLRVPGTINTKGGGTATLLTPVKYHEFASLVAVLGTAPVAQDSLLAKAKALSKGAPVSEVTKLLSGNTVSKFQTIWIKSAGTEGCAQIKHAINNGDNLSEPLWRAVLSIAQHCEDRDWAIHEVSKNHPDYDPDETEAKASRTKGPYTCETYQSLETAHLCAGCPHAGEITSPIQLGKEVRVSNEPAVVEHEGIKYDISYPFPFVRGKNGGIYRYMKEPSGDDGEGGENPLQLIYPYDLYAFRRMRDPELGDVVWMRHHLPNDGVREFMVPQKDIGSADRFRDLLSAQGVTAFNIKQVQNLQLLMTKLIQDLQCKEHAEIMHTRFGWTVHDTFIVGNREYTPDGVRAVPVARHLEVYANWMKPKGTLDAWKAVAAAYEAPGYERHAFGVLASFGSVLMHLSPESGGVINFFSKKSGTGKTTILKMVNSVFGDPRAMMKDAQDTHLSKVHRMGLLNGIVTTLDEMTNVTPQELSGLLYGSTQGRPRDRMQANANAERLNNLSWKAQSLWSMNTNIEDRLSLIKMDPQGEMARVIEFHLETPVPGDVLEAQMLFNSLNDNYGHAGDVFLRHVIPNLPETRVIFAKVRDRVYSKHNWSQSERYRLNIVICNLAAGVITNRLGLTNYDLGRIAKVVLAEIIDSSRDMAAKATTALEAISLFINENINNVLIINSKSRVNGLADAPIREPARALMLRFEPDSKELYIAQREFSKWCTERFINAKEVPAMFAKETGARLVLVKKRMGAGWNRDLGAVNAYQIHDANTVLGIDDGFGKAQDGVE